MRSRHDGFRPSGGTSRDAGDADQDDVPAVVQGITTFARGSRRRIVTGDGREVMASADACARLGVRRGMTLTPGLRRELDALTQADEAHEAALRLLATRDRSESEIRGRLRLRGLGDAAIEGEVARLRATGLVDDARFARSYVADRERLAPRGQRLLRQELRQRGIAADVADVLTSALDDEPAALALARSRARRGSYESYAEFEARAGGFLARRGFDYGVARQALRTAWAELGGAGTGDQGEP